MKGVRVPEPLFFTTIVCKHAHIRTHTHTYAYIGRFVLRKERLQNFAPAGKKHSDDYLECSLRSDYIRLLSLALC